MSQSKTPPPVAGRAPGGLLRLIAIAIFTLCVAVIIAAVLVTRSCTAAASTGIVQFRQAFQPHVNVTNVLDATVDSLHKKAKLVVTQADITAEVYRSEKYQWWVLYFGTTTAHVRATGCKVQYVIALDALSDADVEIVETLNREHIVRIWLPEPAVDQDIVEVNYSQLEVEASSGWARFNKGEVAEEAKKLLRQAAVEKARNPSNIRIAELDAEPTVRKMLEPLAGALQPGVKLEIKFKSPDLP